MPWKVTCQMDARQKFVVRVMQGEKITDLCREFGISRKTGHKFYNRFLESGVSGLADQSRRPRMLARSLNEDLSGIILGLKKKHPTWGAPKLRELLIKKYPTIKPPAISTVHALLVKHDLVRKRRDRSLYKAHGTYLSEPKAPNDLWCTDYKGHFLLKNNSYCYPLTISDHFSRFLFAVEGFEKISEHDVIESFRAVFKEFGMPSAIRSDNGVPFASTSIFGLSQLSVWWLRLGIKLERIKPGNPQQNGRHERMHRTLKLSTTLPAANNIYAQQEKFDAFVEEYNNERPHQALQMKTPSQLHVRSQRSLPSKLPDLIYDTHDTQAEVSKCGSLLIPRTEKRLWIGKPLSGQTLGLKQIDDEIWRVDFMNYELGFFDNNSIKITPGVNPFCLLEENK